VKNTEPELKNGGPQRKPVIGLAVHSVQQSRRSKDTLKALSFVPKKQKSCFRKQLFGDK